ncbi:MAG: hypothetical protein IKU87_02050 [Clostridia bacterium]|nr:hypothetical protein [Clostridia bacterium]
MPEKINKPKRFTKEWRSYIWEYYKGYFIAGIIVVILAAVTVSEVVNTVIPDLTLNFIATTVMPNEMAEELADEIDDGILDVNGDRETEVFVSQLNFTPDALTDANMINALESRLMTMFATEEDMLYVFDEMMLKDVLNMRATEGMFVPVSKWLDAEISQDRFFEYGGGVYAVSLEDSRFLMEEEINAKGLYVAVRSNYNPDDEKINKIYKNCVLVANMLVR